MRVPVFPSPRLGPLDQPLHGPEFLEAPWRHLQPVVAPPLHLRLVGLRSEGEIELVRGATKASDHAAWQ